MGNKSKVAGALLHLSILTVLFGIYREELRIIWNNGKILCLTCIGIK